MPHFGVQNWPLYQDPYGSEFNNRTTQVDPYLARKVALEALGRDYSPIFGNSLMGAETTFGTVDYGPNNPLSYKWHKDERDKEGIIANSPENKQLKETIAGLVEDGMPIQQALPLEQILQARQVEPGVNIRKAFDKLDEKRQWLIDKGKEVTPENLAWVYQGNGVPNRVEVPNRIAYGKPVRQNTPKGDHSTMVRQIMNVLMDPKSELGNYIRQISKGGF